ncbi:hypothetical protein L3V79_04800 [Thiotrichales bacterium 19S9-12]|nr:hypothetical protein [Thiotrichales bacterium 19S9-11]MCF6811675.1 hypothetical protein [Thiotrichales bacterium 19S9-12]
MIFIKKAQHLFLFILINFCLVNIASAYIPKAGDLLFQDLNCGVLCNAITDVTYGYHQMQISHVAMVINNKKPIKVIEAIGQNVHLTSLNDFLERSLDKKGKPLVIVGRLKLKYQPLIPKAIEIAKNWQGLPYNDDFTPNNHFQSFYCSQLIYDAFMLANNNEPIFKQHQMTFKQSEKFLPAWKDYFKEIKKPIPEGELGTNPGMLSRSKNIEIIYSYSDNLRYAH